MKRSARTQVPPWIAPTFSGTWVNYGSPYENVGYTRDANRRVHLRGMTKSGTVGTSVFTLASGYRPANDEIFPVASNDAFGEVIVKADGTVVVFVGDATFVSLSGISFRAAP